MKMEKLGQEAGASEAEEMKEVPQEKPKRTRSAAGQRKTGQENKAIYL